MIRRLLIYPTYAIVRDTMRAAYEADHSLKVDVAKRCIVHINGNIDQYASASDLHGLARAVRGIEFASVEGLIHVPEPFRSEIMMRVRP